MKLIRQLFQVSLIAIAVGLISGCVQKSSCATSPNPSECVAKEAQDLLLDKYAVLIHRSIANVWRNPVGDFPAELSVQVSILVGPSGEVLDAKTMSSTGYLEVDQSGVDAVYAASPLPIPPEKKYYEHFRKMEIVFVVPVQ